MTKSEFCFATGLTMYKLRNILEKNEPKYARLGVTKYDKLLMPAAVRELLAQTGLRIDIDYYMQYVARKRGVSNL